MGFLDLIQTQSKTPTVPSVLPDAARMQIMGGKLPVLQMTSLFLKKGEQCHYAEQAIYEKKTVRQRKVRKNAGVSAPGPIKGTRIHLGGGDSTSVEDVQYSSIKGVLYITNKRIIFVSSADGFDRKIDELVAATPYANCIELQFEKDILKLFVPDGSIANKVLYLIHNYIGDKD